MAILDAMDVTNESENLKCLVVGDYGTGKSVFAASFPTPAFLFDFDKGVLTYKKKDFKYSQYEISAKGWVEFEKEFSDVEKRVKEGEFKTAIIDSTSLMADLAMERALMLDPKRSATGGPLWNVHYGIVRNLIEGKIRKFLQWDCNIVIISHLQVVTDQESGAVIKIQPMLPGALSDKVPGYFDEVYIAQSTMEGGKPKFQLQTLPKGFYKARSRMSGKEQILPMYVPNDYGELMAAMKKGKEVNKK